MLSALRSIVRSPIAVVLIIGPIVAAFALFGINDIFTGSGNAVALVGPERVSTRDLAQAYQTQLTAIQRQNPGFTREDADAQGLGEQVLDRLIGEAALDAKANALGLSVSDEHLAETIQNIEAFASPFSGEFDASTYRQVLAENRFTVAQFERSMREDLRRQQLVIAAVSGLNPPSTLASAREAYAREQRTVRALLLPPALAGEPAQPADEDLQTLIDENPRLFQIPETRRFTLVRASVDDFIRDVSVPEEDLRTLYEIQLENGELADPPTRTFRLFAAPDAETAEDLAAALRNGAPAQQAVAERGLEAPVPFDAVQSFQVPDAAVAEAVFSMQAGDVRAVEGRLGWRVISVSAAEDPETPTFEAVRESLRQEIAGSEAEGLLFDALSRFEEARADGATLEAAAGQAGLFAERFNAVTRQGQSLEGGPLATLRETPEILSTVFELPEGFAGDLAETEAGGYFFARVDAIEPERVPPLEDVRDRAEAVWAVRSTDEALESIAADALARVEGGESLDAIAADIGAPARVEQATLGRSDTAGPFTQRLVGAAFGAAPDQPFLARAGDGTTRAIAVVTDVQRPAPGAVSADTREALVEEMQNDLFLTMREALLTEYPARTDAQLRDLALGRTQPDAL